MKIDAWVTWDPYLAMVEKTGSARILRNATEIATQGGYYIALRTFATENPELVRLILEEIDKVGKWADANPQEVKSLLIPELKIDPQVLEVVIRRRSYGLRPITQEIMAGQQRIADLFYQTKVIPKSLNIQEAMLTPEQYANITPTTISQINH